MNVAGKRPCIPSLLMVNRHHMYLLNLSKCLILLMIFWQSLGYGRTVGDLTVVWTKVPCALCHLESFQVLPPLSKLFTRWMHKISPKNVGNLKSAVAHYVWAAAEARLMSLFL